MSARGGVAADSVPALYRAMRDELAGYLREHFGVTLQYETLSDLQGYLVASRRPRAPIVLVLGDHLTELEQVYLLTHTAAHLLLGHAGRPFATILEPRRTRDGLSLQLDDWQAEQERDADLLTGAILRGSDHGTDDALRRHAGLPPDDVSGEVGLMLARSLSRLLVGHRRRAWKLALVSGVTRTAVLHGLRLVRAVSHRSGVRRALAGGPVVRDLRELYCLVELATVTPEPLLADRRASVAMSPEPGPWSAGTWLDISETRSWLDAAREDRSLLN